MDFIDFDIRIGQRSSHGEYPLYATCALSGEARATMRFELDKLALENRLQAVKIALLQSGGTHREAEISTEQRGVQRFGKELFDAVMVDELRSCFRVSRRQAIMDGKGVRIRMRFDAPELAALPWEYLFDESEGDYLCLSVETPLIRYLEVERPIAPLKIEAPLKVLVMIASPTDIAALDTQRERQRMDRSLAPLIESGRIEIHWLEGQTWRHLQRALRKGPWHVFHFIGHGCYDANDEEGQILLANQDGKAYRFSATKLGRLLADHNSLRLTVLNACSGATGNDTDIFSSTASVLMRRGMPAVVAMQFAISDRAAIEFTGAFYEAISEGLPVDMALSEARKAMSMCAANTVEWGTPVLHMRASSGALFDVDRTARKRPQKKVDPEKDSDNSAGGAPPLKVVSRDTSPDSSAGAPGVTASKKGAPKKGRLVSSIAWILVALAVPLAAGTSWYLYKERRALLDAEAALWEDASNSNDVARLQDYLQRYGEKPGTFTDDANFKIDEMDGLLVRERSYWQERKDSNDPRRIEEYVTRYGKSPGTFTLEANDKIAELNALLNTERAYWQERESSQDPERIKQYLDRYGDAPGTFTSEANTILERLRAEEREKSARRAAVSVQVDSAPALFSKVWAIKFAGMLIGEDYESHAQNIVDTLRSRYPNSTEAKILAVFEEDFRTDEDMEAAISEVTRSVPADSPMSVFVAMMTESIAESAAAEFLERIAVKNPSDPLVAFFLGASLIGENPDDPKIISRGLDHISRAYRLSDQDPTFGLGLAVAMLKLSSGQIPVDFKIRVLSDLERLAALLRANKNTPSWIKDELGNIEAKLK